MSRLLLGFAGLAWCMVACGCGPSADGPKTAPVSGIITLNGQPLTDADVDFINLEQDFAAHAKTDGFGAYRLTGGAAPGENRVVIRQLSPDQQDLAGGVDLGQDQAAIIGNAPETPATPPSEEGLPPEYGDSSRTPLTYQVPENGTDKANFNL